MQNLIIGQVKKFHMSSPDAAYRYKYLCWLFLRNIRDTLMIWYVTWALFQYTIRRLIVRSRKVSKQWDLYWELSDCSDIWHAPRQQCCRGVCRISKWCDNSNYQSRGFESSRDLTIRRLIGYWNWALLSIAGDIILVGALSSLSITAAHLKFRYP